MQDQLKDGKQP